MNRTSANARTLKVLVIDDDPLYLELLEFMLSGEGYDVLVARDADAAVQLAATVHPDIILSDVNMPGMDGYTLAAGLKADPRTMEIPLIFLSARSPEEGCQEGVDAGAAAYVVKPFLTEDLIAAIQRAGRQVRAKGGYGC